MTARSIGVSAPGGVQVTVVFASGYTAPTVNDLVYFSTGANFEVTEAVAGNNADGKLVWVATDLSCGVVQCFGTPSFEELPYKSGSAPALGQKVEGSATAGSVQLDNSNGAGYCVALDWPTSGYVVIGYGLTGAGGGG